MIVLFTAIVPSPNPLPNLGTIIRSPGGGSGRIYGYRFDKNS